MAKWSAWVGGAAVGYLLAVSGAVWGQDTAIKFDGQQIPAPACLMLHPIWEGAAQGCAKDSHEAWLKDITHWRDERLIRIGYSGERYEMPALKWTQSSFIQPQMMAHDRYLYDPVAGKYTVDRYLDDLENRYGGIDAVLVWPTYPNMGIDDRNQHDLIRTMPGGVAGVRQMVADFHRRGVKVLFPMMMWDQGTHDPGKPWTQAIAETMKEIGADGVNGDTQDGVPLAYSKAADAVGHPLAFEPEGSPSDEALAWNVMTWGQYSFPFVPQVDRFKWLETRHMVNISDRWARDKTNDLQYGFFNGVGWESWENVWGIWNGISDRDAEATRRVATMERATSDFLTSREWEPHVPMLQYGVFASRWPKAGETVWTIVNRNEYEVDGAQMQVADLPGTRYFDLYHGVEIMPKREGGQAVLEFAMEAHGYGAVLATKGEADAKIADAMKKMRGLTAKSLGSFKSEREVLKQTLVEIPATKAAKNSPAGMVRIEGGQYRFVVKGIEIEGEDEIGVDVQYPWEDSPRRFHSHAMEMKTFFIDKYPVTNAEFKRFLDATQYAPKDALNFLKEWKGGMYPAGWERRPVTWVSLEDARAYAAWAVKRLPHEWEWQYAAEGAERREYPWGQDWDAKAVPTANKTRALTAPDSVDAHLEGASASGVMDLVGNVWQWTDEYGDEHTRAAILRGGSYYQPQGSIWYFPQAYRNDQHGKLLLMGPGMDRSGTVGFRCVRDSE